MPYTYAVVWFTKAKFWIEEKNNPCRPLETNCRVFKTLAGAQKFQKEWFKPYPRIYEVK